MYSVTEGEDVNGTAKFCVNYLEQFAINSARQQFSRPLNALRDKDTSAVDNNEHHSALLGRFVVVAPSINVETYLLTYLCEYSNKTQPEPSHIACDVDKPCAIFRKTSLKSTNNSNSSQ